MEFKEHKINNGTYNEKVFITTTGKSIKGHFVFDLTRSMLQKKFSRKFAKLIPGLKSRHKIPECHPFQMSLENMEFKEQHHLDNILQLRQLRSIIQELWKTLSKKKQQEASLNLIAFKKI